METAKPRAPGLPPAYGSRKPFILQGSLPCLAFVLDTYVTGLGPSERTLVFGQSGTQNVSTNNVSRAHESGTGSLLEGSGGWYSAWRQLAYAEPASGSVWLWVVPQRVSLGPYPTAAPLLELPSGSCCGRPDCHPGRCPSAAASALARHAPPRVSTLQQCVWDVTVLAACSGMEMGRRYLRSAPRFLSVMVLPFLVGQGGGWGSVGTVA